MMGPYCRFCQRRCFVYTAAWPEKVRAAYGRFTIAATCSPGQEYERQKLGYCYADVRAEETPDA